VTANGPVVNVSQSSSSGRVLPVEPDANPADHQQQPHAMASSPQPRTAIGAR
jgi:hypothetical protein